MIKDNIPVFEDEKTLVTLLGKKESTFNELALIREKNSTSLSRSLKKLEKKGLINSFWKKEFNEKDGHTRITKIYLTTSQNFSKLKSTNHLSIKQNKTLNKNSKWNQNEFS